MQAFWVDCEMTEMGKFSTPINWLYGTPFTHSTKERMWNRIERNCPNCTQMERRLRVYNCQNVMKTKLIEIIQTLKRSHKIQGIHKRI